MIDLILSEDQKQLLRSQTIDGEHPGTVLHDFQAILDRVGVAGVESAGKYNLLPMSLIGEFDQLLSRPLHLSLKMKRPQTVLVRIPSWTDRKPVSCSVNGKRREYTWEGSYIRVGAVESADEVVVSFPVAEKTLQREIKSHKYTVTFRGFTVIDLLPKPGM